MPEREAKLVIMAERPDAIADEIAALTSLAGQPLAAAGAVAQRDTYFDTPAGALRARQQSLRLRVTATDTLVTLKGAARDVHPGVTERDELERAWSAGAYAEVRQALARQGIALPAVPGAAPVADPTPRFQSFRILAQQQVLDADLKDSLGKLLGDSSNFDASAGRCAPNVVYPEFGLSFATAPGAQSNDLLVSMGCNVVVSRTFSWPHPATGMKPSTVGDLSEIFTKIFPQGT